jgi:hypothetical protein
MLASASFIGFSVRPTPVLTNCCSALRLASTALQQRRIDAGECLAEHRLDVDRARRIPSGAERGGAGDGLDDLLDAVERELAALQRLQGRIRHRLPQRFALLGARLGKHRDECVLFDPRLDHVTSSGCCSCRLSRAGYCMCWPPLMAMFAPVTKAASSDAR